MSGSDGPRVVLIGPMGVGKSTVGGLLAERLGCAYRDTDDDIVTARGRAIADIFVDEGEAHFRYLEKIAVAAALVEHDGILALGGGAILDADTRELLTARPVVLLSMDVEEAVKRTGPNVARPLLAVNPRKQWRELMDARRHLYTEVARVVVATDGRTPDEVAQMVLDVMELKRTWRGGSLVSRSEARRSPRLEEAFASGRESRARAVRGHLLSCSW